MSKYSLNKKSENLISSVFSNFKPKSKLNVLEFAKKYGALSQESSSVVGRFIPYPYQEQILISFSDSKIEFLAWMKSTRVGYTKCINFAIAYHISEDPSPQIILHPNDTKAGEWSKKEFRPMLRDMPYVGEKIIKTKQDDTLNYKAYFGGFIQSLGGQTANNYASVTAKKVFIDEVDRLPDDVDKEGDPISLITKRTDSFWDGFVSVGSTPTVKYNSKIETAFKSTDMMYRYLPCPFCNFYQILEFKNIRWDTVMQEGVKVNLTDTAKLECINCKELIDNKHKMSMDEKGQWRQTKDFFCCNEWQSPKEQSVWNSKGEALCYKCNDVASYNKSERIKKGFHIWAGYSHQPNTTWVKIAELWIECLGDDEKIKVFYNTILAKTWEEKTYKINYNALYEQREDYTRLPNGTRMLLMVVDTQNDRLEYLIKAWCDYETSYNIAAGKIMGDPVNKIVWDKLLELSQKKFLTENNTEVYIYKSFIDMGGGRTDDVKKFQRKHKDTFFMLKGDDKENKRDDNRSIALLKKTQKDDLIVWIATTKAKDIIFKRMGLPLTKDGSIHNNLSFESEWFNQIGAEKKIFKKDKKGFINGTYVKVRERNEALDLEVYQLGAVRLLQDEIKKFDLFP